VVFVLHDIFQMPFDTVARTVGRSAPSCRQLARRARTKIQSENDRAALGVDAVEHRMVADRFIQACSNGDVSALLELLDPEVSGDVDLGALDKRTGTITRGPRSVVRNLLRYFGSGTSIVSNPVGTRMVLLSFAARRLQAVILLTIEDRLIKKLHAIADPDKIGFLGDQLGPAQPGNHEEWMDPPTSP
jgi:RNA polymerase sigma-70 factor (ECF subfamily)